MMNDDEKTKQKKIINKNNKISTSLTKAQKNNKII